MGLVRSTAPDGDKVIDLPSIFCPNGTVVSEGKLLAAVEATTGCAFMNPVEIVGRGGHDPQSIKD